MRIASVLSLVMVNHNRFHLFLRAKSTTVSSNTVPAPTPRYVVTSTTSSPSPSISTHNAQPIGRPSFSTTKPSHCSVCSCTRPRDTIVVDANAPVIASAIHSRSSGVTRRTSTGLSSLHRARLAQRRDLELVEAEDLQKGPVVV